MSARVRRVLVLAACCCVSGGAAAQTGLAASHPLDTAVVDYGSFNTPADVSTAFAHVQTTGARAVRLYVEWRQIAPPGASKPPGFDAGNPADPRYNWTLVDQQVREARRFGLEPLMSIESAPDWAEGSGPGLPGTVRPDPAEFALFARAAARRYSGTFAGLPRVRRWEAWNEPNYFRHLSPQYDTPADQPAGPQSHLLSPDIYRGLLNAFYVAIHGVRGDNIVVGGALSPFGNEGAGTHVARTLPFMRALLCLSATNRPLRGCAPVRFDVWAHQPYTAGGPYHHNLAPQDVSLGDLPKMKRVLDAGVRTGHVRSRGRVKFWVTEFSWDSDPPDANAVPMNLLTRWVPEAFYQMWRNGVSLVTWFQIRDDVGVSPDNKLFQSGLYFGCDQGIACDTPKPFVQSFRFPLVAYPAARRRLTIWGRTPTSRSARVLIEQRVGTSWRSLGALSANRYGIFSASPRRRGSGPVRARLAGAAGRQPTGQSLPFVPVRLPDRRVDPFG
jgi:hypothetical protein